LLAPQENWTKTDNMIKYLLKGEFSMAARKNFTTEEILAILSEAQSSCTTKVAVCRKYGISKTTLDYWRKKLFNPNDNNNHDDEKVNLRKENIMLRSIIVEKDLEIAYLKELLKKTNRL